MNAVSQALRVIAIVAALAAAGIYFLSEKKTQQAKSQAAAANAQLAQANTALAAAKTAEAAAEQDKDTLQKQIDEQKNKDAGYETLLQQARTDASNATHAVSDKDAQIQDLTTQVATLKQQAAQVDALQAQVASLQAAAAAAPAANSTAAAGNTTATAAGNTTAAATPTFSTTPTPVNIVQLDARHGLIVIGAGTDGGLANDAQLVIQQSGNKVAELQITDAEPDFSVAMILTGSSTKQLKKGQSVDYIRVR